MDYIDIRRCRTCLAQNRKMIQFSEISQASNHPLQLADLFMSCAAIQIKPDDGFSQFACSTCVSSAEKAYVFKKKCEYNEKIWSEFKRRLKKAALASVAATPLINLDDENSNPVERFEKPVDKCEMETNFHNENPEPPERVQGPVETKCETVQVPETQELIDLIDIKEEVKTESFICTYCNLIFADEGKLSRHELVHTIQPKRLFLRQYVIYVCRDCSVDVKTAEDFVEHCHKFHEDSIERLYYRCKLCAKEVRALFQITSHVTRKRHRDSWIGLSPDEQRPKIWPQKCKYCKLFLKSHKEKLTHFDQDHGDLKTTQCNKCGKKFFNRRLMRQHLEIHNEIKRHMCQHCGRSFASSANLVVHIRIHTGEKPFKCNKCDSCFTQWASLRSHQLKHVAESKFECEVCHKLYKSPASLRMHVKTHAGDRPKFPCHLCAQQFADSQGLKRHLLIHSDLRSYMCKVCGKGFNSMSNLRQHMNTHAAIKPYICTICNKGFSQAHCLRSHNATFHKHKR